MNPFFFGSKGRGTFRFLRILLHLPNFVRLTWQLFQDERVPIYRKAIFIIAQILAGALAIAYFVYPIDFDFLPIIGRVDDLVIAVLLILVPGAWLFIRLCPEHIVREHVNRISQEK